MATLAICNHPNLRPESDHPCSLLLLFCETITTPRIVLTSSPDLLCSYTLHFNPFNHIESSILSLNHSIAVFTSRTRASGHAFMLTQHTKARAWLSSADESSAWQNNWDSHACVTRYLVSCWQRISNTGALSKFQAKYGIVIRRPIRSNVK